MAAGRRSGHLMISSLVALLLIIPLMIVADHHGDGPESATTLATRLKLMVVDDDAAPAPPSYCWESLVQLQSCTGEAIMFFLNGEAYLGEACCTAIRTVARQCWPDMLQALGFTAAEGDMLEDYCDHQNNINNGTDHYSLDDQPHKEPAAAANAEIFGDGTQN